MKESIALVKVAQSAKSSFAGDRTYSEYQIRKIAQLAFCDALTDEAHFVITELDKDGLPWIQKWKERGSKPDGTDPISAWGQRRYLTDPWLLQAATRYLIERVNGNTKADRLLVASDSARMSDPVTIVLFDYDDPFQTLEQNRDRLMEMLGRQVDFALDQADRRSNGADAMLFVPDGMSRAEVVSAIDQRDREFADLPQLDLPALHSHMRWLVQRQVMGWSFSRIASNDGNGSSDHVGRSVKTAASLAQLTLRSDDQGGRPRMKRYRTVRLT